MGRNELSDYGIQRMSGEEVTAFLSGQSVGILGLPTGEAPAMRPMSYWFDGGERLYFLYVLGPGSRKEALSSAADAARFLVYRAETPFNWQSVLLTGTIRSVPPAEREAVEAEMELAWQPAVFREADADSDTDIYEFEIHERVGLKHLGLPPGMREQ
ncbi:MAG: pyridoxamine 5'-phosphate oxidase family protein [Haloarculaceae archaeon]